VEQEQISGKIELCHKFGYRCGMVQLALAALEDNRCLCRLPGTIPRSIGVVANLGIAGILDDIDSSLLSSLIRKMTPAWFSLLLFHMISMNTLKQLENALRNHGIWVLLWISPSTESIPFFLRELLSIGCRLPAVAVMSSYYHSGMPFMAFNVLKRDY